MEGIGLISYGEVESLYLLLLSPSGGNQQLSLLTGGGGENRSYFTGLIRH